MFSDRKTIVDVIRSYVYAYLFSEKNPIATQHGYLKVIQSIPDSSRILDVGVGSGVYFSNPHVIQTIKDKNLSVYAIDVDLGATLIAQERVNKAGLKTHVECKCRDLLDLSQNKDGIFDFVMFFESFPVIPRALFKTLIQHSKTLLKKGGNLILYHTLENVSKPWLRVIKPYLYYVTMCDFGSECTTDEMHAYCEEWGYDAKQRQIEPCLQTTYKEMCELLSCIPTIKDWVITTYTIKLAN